MLNGLKHHPAGLIEVPITSTSLQALASTGEGLSLPTVLDQAPVEAAQSRLIDQLLADGFAWLRFPAELEARFRQDCSGHRLKAMLVSGMLVAVLFNVLLISDQMMTPDVFELALKLRLFMFTPFVILGLFIVTKIPSLQVREWLEVVCGLGVCFMNVYLCVNSREALAAPYLVSLIPIVLFLNSVAQMRFMKAVIMDTGAMLMFVIGAWMKSDVAAMEILIPSGLTLASAIVFSLYGCYTMERDERRNWLMHLREKVLLKDLEEANAHLDSVSRSDMLTEVANRRHFDEYLQQVWDRALHDGSEISLIMIDVDHFKAYNDRYGHPQGDACLKDVAATLKRRLRRPGDLIARFGGEEFIAILAGTPLSTAVGAAERVRKGVESLNRLHATSSTHAVVTVSLGVACLRPNAPHATPAQLISAADEALYQAKSRGRNRVFAFGTND
jgi:diguanylate cyclase (GGDEF)-like protein